MNLSCSVAGVVIKKVSKRVTSFSDERQLILFLLTSVNLISLQIKKGLFALVPLAFGVRN